MAEAATLSRQLSPRSFAPHLPDGLRKVDLAHPDAAASEPAILVPGEHIILLTAELPLPTQRQRREALPFAVEDMLGEAIGDLHIVLGPALGDGRYLAAAIRHELMQRWVEALGLAGIGDLPMLPDTTRIPVPPLGWLVHAEEERALVRIDDGTGFAAPVQAFESLWRSAGSPPVQWTGEPPPPMLNAKPAGDELAEPAPGIDLRSGRYAIRREGVLPWRRLALVAGAGIAAHLAIYAADTLTLREMAEESRAEANAAWVEALPDTPIPEDMLPEVADRLSLADTPGGGFLNLTAQMSAALLPLADVVTVSELGYDAADGALSVTLETEDFAGLQAVQQQLSEAGLRPVSGSARATPGGAEAAFTMTAAAG